MKMVHSELSGEIISESAAFTEWIIESPKEFSEYLHELYCQYEKDEGRFVLSQRDKILELSKYLEIIVNPFTVEINSRKILNKLYIKLEKVSKEEQMYEETLELTAYIHEYLMQLEQQTNYILSFDDNLEIPALLKAVGIKHEEMEDDFFERIIRYVKIAVEVLSTKVFVFVNIRSYLTDEQIQELIKEIRYQEAKILFMESQERACLEGGMRYIIDRDGCEIY
mgnify:FL=1